MSLVKRGAGLAILALAWGAVYVGFGLGVPNGRFFDPENLQVLLRQASIVGCASIGMTFVIIRRAIDLSVGSSVALVTVMVALALKAGADPVMAAMAGIATGVAVGAFNGLVTTWLRVSPFIATLGTLLVLRGLAKGLAGEQKVDVPVTYLRSILGKLGPEQSWMLVPPGVWTVLLLAVGAAWILAQTSFGRSVVAEGSNEDAAVLAGLKVRPHLLGVFIFSGLFVGVAGLLQFSRLTVGDPTVAVGLELDVIAAVVIGGASLSGGQGSIAGAMLGALIMATIRSGCSQAGLPNWIQEVVTGGIIVAAVALDRVRSDR